MAFLKKNPQFQLKVTAKTVDELNDNLGFIQNDGNEGQFFLDRFVVQLSDGKRTEKLESISKLNGWQILNRGEIPTAPASIPKLQLQVVKDRGFRLLGIDANKLKNNPLDIEKLTQRLTKIGFNGEVKFSSSKAAFVFEEMLSAKEKHPEIVGIEANWFGTPAIPYVEHRDIYGASPYSTTDSNIPLYQNRVNGSNGSSSAWDLKAIVSGFPSNFKVPLTGAGVSIAILDTGFDTSNYDLTGWDPVTSTYVASKAISQYDFTDYDSNVNVPVNGDCVQGNTNWNCYHGTYAAASAAGARNNHYGSAGSAPDANLMLFRIKGWAGFIWGSYIIDFYRAGQAVDTSIAWGAKVISMSFSSPGGLACGNVLISCNLRSSIQNAVANYNIVPVASAGNENCECSRAPGDWPEVMSIGALEISPDVRASYSNWGSTVELFSGAYGYSVPVPTDSCYAGTRCVNNNFTEFAFAGTSSAAPYAAGVIALIKQYLPSYNFYQVKSALEFSARASTDPKVGRRIIDAYSTLYQLGARP
ncbi:MAG: S8/S53 family peptidase [Pleurocapsa sp. SU_196_0]|nr:S8/S53 family peptidase [Pleurocapsa sp. SU_196_0]